MAKVRTVTTETETVSENRRILLVVDRTFSDARVVRPSVRALVERRAAHVYVVAPIFTTRLHWVTNDDGSATADAEQRLTQTLQQLYDRDIPAGGAVSGDLDILTAINDALAQFPADEIIIAVNADHERTWRESNLAEKIRSHCALPLTELLCQADGSLRPELPG